jgi:putative CocE/NonD family hydrolase
MGAKKTLIIQALALLILILCLQIVSAQEDKQKAIVDLQKQATELLQQGDMPGAKALLKKALAIDPDDMMCRYLLASIYVFENYDKQTYQVEMRDGVKLHTQVYTPKDKSIPYPIIYCRSPYSSFAYGEGFQSYFGFLGPGPKFIEEKYIFVIQDVRGRFLSEGQFEVMRPNKADWKDPHQADESTDAYDSIDWMIKNIKNHNGRVGIWGGSYLAYYGALALVNAHPALKAVSLESPVAEVLLGDDYHHNGAFHLAFSFLWLNNIGFDRSEGPSASRPPRVYTERITDLYSFFLKAGPLKNINEEYFKDKVPFWNDILAHGTYDEFWKSRSLGQYLRGIKGPAVLMAGSWFDDQDLYGTLYTYRALERQNPGLDCTLIMGCWNHAPWWDQKTGSWGDVRLPAGKIGDLFRDELLVSFFNAHLKGRGEFKVPKVMAFESGTNVMREYGSWPPENAVEVKFYLGADGKLLDHTPDAGTPQCDEFVSDPANPVPFYNLPMRTSWDADFMFYDQRFAAERSDVLHYQSVALTENLTLAGPVKVDLYVSTTGTDADWIVKIIDVFPEGEGDLAGYQMLVRGDIMRSKFRDSFEKPTPLVPGEITHIEFNLPDINHTFIAGHRIMIQVQSSWFPLFDRNPQQFIDIYSASAEDFKVATHRVYHSAVKPSGISVLRIPRD